MGEIRALREWQKAICARRETFNQKLVRPRGELEKKDACLEYACASRAIVQFDNAQHGLAEPPRRLHEGQHGNLDAVLIHIVRDLLGHTREGLDGLAAACQATRRSVLQLMIVRRRHAPGW